MELSHLWRAVIRHWAASLVTLLCFVTAAGFFAYSPANEYDATTTLITEPVDITTGNPVSTVTFLLAGLQAELGSAGVHATATDRVGAAVRNQSVRINSSTEPGTGILRITATGKGRSAVAPWADAYADALIRRQPAQSPIRIRIIDPASRPGGASGPARLSLAISGAVLGLIAAVVAALIAEAARRRRDVVDQIAHRLNVPVFGHIPRIRHGADRPADALNAGEPRVVDAVLSLRASVEAQLGQAPSSLCVTALELGEGTSTVVTLLAWALARASREVVVIDADLRTPRLRDTIAPAGGRLFDADIGVVVSSRTNQHVQLVSGGDLSRLAAHALLTVPDTLHPAEILAVAVPQVLRDREASGSVVLIDTPALLRASDAVAVANVADAVVVVVDVRRRGAITRAEDAVARVRRAGGSVIGVIANRTEQRPRKPAMTVSVASGAAGPAGRQDPLQDAVEPGLSDSNRDTR